MIYQKYSLYLHRLLLLKMKKGKRIKNISLLSCEDSNQALVTSLEIVQEVMNVPMCALTSLLRVNGFNDNEDPSSLCIDEKRLKVFVKAYIRKMRSYFLSSLRNISSLSLKERYDFNHFVKLFRKKGDVRSTSCSWSDIDEKKIEQVFRSTIKKKTPRDTFSILPYKFNDLFEHVCLTCDIPQNAKLKDTFYNHNLFEKVLSIDKRKYNADDILKTVTSRFSEEENLLLEITCSDYYVAKITCTVTRNNTVDFIEKILRSARYYIYSSDSDDDHNNINAYDLKYILLLH